MALVTSGFQLTVSLLDNGGVVSNLEYNLIAADAAAAATATATILAALSPDMTQSVISGYRLTEVFVEDALALPGANIDNNIKASITALLSGAGSKKAVLRVPAPPIAIFTAATGSGANIVDGQDAAVTAYLDLFKLTGGVATISDGETLSDNDTFVSGARTSTTTRRS